MDIAVRYHSKYGRTQRIAEAIAEGCKVKALSIVDEPKLEKHYDILFLGGAPYANIMTPELRKYGENISSKDVDRVVLFTTSNWSRRTVYALRKILNENNVDVEKDYFYAHMLQIDGKIKSAKEFSENIVSKYKKES